MEAAKQCFGQDLNIAQLNLEHLDAREWEINCQLKSGEETGADRLQFLAALVKGLDLLHEAYMESGRQCAMRSLLARQHSLAEEQCSYSELLARDNEGLEEMVDMHSKTVEERIRQHQVAEQQAKQQRRDSLEVIETFSRQAVIRKARSDSFKAMVTR